MKKPISDPNKVFRTGQQHFHKGQYQQAINLLVPLHQAFPKEAGIVRLLGAAYSELKRHDDAIGYFLKAVELKAAALDFFNLGKALQLAGMFAKALRAHDTGLKLAPREPQLLQGRATTLTQLGRRDEAIAAYRLLFKIAPDFAEGYANFGEALLAANQTAAALTQFEHASAANGDDIFALSGLVRAKLVLSNWVGLDSRVSKLCQLVEAGQRADPFTLLTLSDRPELQLNASRLQAGIERGHYSETRLPASAPSACQGKIRVAYVSADFRNHPMSHLIAGVLAAHDRDRFEIIAVSTGQDDHSAIRQRIVSSVDRFIDACGLSTLELATLVRDLDAHIAVDLMGYTTNANAAIFHSRLAHVQVSFLGYPGTTAIDTIDYILLDRFVATPRLCQNITEKPVILPHCYFPGDSARPRPSSSLPRQDYALPADAFVFCCFNNTGKITPSIFALWMRILAAVENSVLWLYVTEPEAIVNLRAHAAAHAIAPERLIFAGKAPMEAHLARYLAADLALDTFPYGSHTTGTDALWMGCPLVALAGETFPARVCGSLLHTIGLPQLVAHSQEDYERLAIGLANSPQTLAVYRRHLDTHRSTTPLFDATLFAHGLDRAYAALWQRRQRGEKPKPLDLTSAAGS